MYWLTPVDGALVYWLTPVDGALVYWLTPVDGATIYLHNVILLTINVISRFDHYIFMAILEQHAHKLGHFAKLNHNIYIVAYPNPYVDNAGNAGGPTMFTQRIMTTHLH